MISICEKPARFEAKNYSYLFDEKLLLSKEQLNLHFSIYQKYSDKFKEISRKEKEAEQETSHQNNSEYREIKIDGSYNNNAIILHDLYFTNLTGEESPASDLYQKHIYESFGKWNKYIGDFEATARAARGWAVTAYNFWDRKIWNYGLDSHNLYVPIGVFPLMVLDVYEHAYMLDYGSDKEAYIKLIMRNLDWPTASKRLECLLNSGSTNKQ